MTEEVETTQVDMRPVLFPDYEYFVGSIMDPNSTNFTDRGDLVYVNSMTKEKVDEFTKVTKSTASQIGGLEGFRKEADESAFKYRLAVPSRKTPDNRYMVINQYDIVVAQKESTGKSFAVNVIKNTSTVTIH